MITNDFISPINQKKEYFQISGNLTNSMHLFFLYDDNDKESLEFWSDFLKNLIEKFQKHLKISTISNDINTHKDLMQLYTDGDIKDIKYPSIILTHAHLYDPQIVIGITPIDLYSLIEQFDNFYTNEFEKEKEKMFIKIKNILDSYPVIGFIQGTPQNPFCRFSRRFIELLNKTQIRYKTINILDDKMIINYLKLYSGWKTYPQLYINGKIIGGGDTLAELIEKNQFMDMVPNEVKLEVLKKNINEIITNHKIVLACEKKNELIEIIKNKKGECEVLDIGKDSRILYILKNDFNATELPSLFINGKYAGSTEYIKTL